MRSTRWPPNSDGYSSTVLQSHAHDTSRTSGKSAFVLFMAPPSRRLGILNSRGDSLAARYVVLTQAQLAERMGTQAPAVARLERALATGKHSPSIATLRRYIKACGKILVLQIA